MNDNLYIPSGDFKAWSPMKTAMMFGFLVLEQSNVCNAILQLVKQNFFIPQITEITARNDSVRGKSLFNEFLKHPSFQTLNELALFMILTSTLTCGVDYLDLHLISIY